MPRLSVNVNKIALLRNSRQGKGPDLVRLSRVALDSGAGGITVHPRPDERHIRYDDVAALKALVDEYQQAEFNIEGNPFEGQWLELVLKTKPDQATLVPDTPGQSTSDHGFAMPADIERLVPVVDKLKQAGIRISIFMDPNAEQIAQVRQTGADRIELYTETFAVVHGTDDQERITRDFALAAGVALEQGLGVNAGHDLNLANLKDFADAMPQLDEVSIGHALVGDAIELGLRETVRRYNEQLNGVAGRSMWEAVSAQRAAVIEPAGYTNDVRRQSR
ncbi:MAG: pyridoxine 5'-phosphate synthase [Planctomycetota bacterium]